VPECNKFSLCNFDQAILLVGHGSSSQPMSGEILLEYGQYMSSRGYFRKIEVGAILCTPPLINALQTLKGSVRVLPVMMSNRHIVRDSTNELVEREDEFPSPFQLSFWILLERQKKSQVLHTPLPKMLRQIESGVFQRLQSTL